MIYIFNKEVDKYISENIILEVFNAYFTKIGRLNREKEVLTSEIYYIENVIIFTLTDSKIDNIEVYYYYMIDEDIFDDEYMTQVYKVYRRREKIQSL